MRYDKLVRDNIPDVIRNAGKVPRTHIADDGEYLEKLRDKLKEEVDEFLGDTNEEEFADILEVLDAISEVKSLDVNKVHELKKKKSEERGGFWERIILDEVLD